MAKAKQPVSIGGIEVDALIDEGRTLTSTVPEYAVEDGFSVSDTIILSPEELSMVVYVTNTPVTWKSRHGNEKNRVKNVCKKLEELYFSKECVTIITSDAVYKNMAIQNIEFKKSIETGYSREIPISFKKVNITSAKTTKIPSSYGKSGKTKAPAGTASTTTGKKTSSTASKSSSSKSSTTDKKSDSESTKKNKSSILYSAAKSIGLIK